MPSLRKVLPTAVCALCLAAGTGTAGAAPPRKTAPPDPTADAERYRVWHDTVRWDAAVYWHNIELLALYYTPPTPRIVTTSPPVVPARPSVRNQPSGAASAGGATGACGGATNGADAYIQRESGGNPNAVNPSGARGCYQLMPMHFGAHGACSDLTPGPGDAACASRLPLSAWSSSGPTG